MVEVIQSGTFKAWLTGLRDRAAARRVAIRIERLAAGNPGDHKGVGEGVMELRLTYGPGYRVYYTHEGVTVIVLLAGGDKSTQAEDIAKAKAIAAERQAARQAEMERRKTMAEAFSQFDAADILHTNDDFADYLEAAAEFQDAATLTMALATVARARNISKLARDTGLSREGLNKALGPNGNPTLATVMKLADALGFEVAFRRKAAA